MGAPGLLRFARCRIAIAGTGLIGTMMGCGNLRGGSNVPSGTSPVEVRAASDHPSLSLVAREGDPYFGIAVAAAHDLGSTASLWVEALVEDRLTRATSLSIEPRPSSNGFVLRARISSPEEAARFVRAARDALSTSVTAAEFPRLVEQVNAGPTARPWASAADRAVGECVGELGGTASKPPTLGDVEHFRQAIFSSHSVAFAVVGPHVVLEATAKALHDTDVWPSASAPSDAWPPADLAGTAPGDPGSPTLSLALRLADPARVLEAAKVLGGRNSALVTHTAALEPKWSVVRVVGAIRPRGACLRIDLEAEPGADPSLSDVAGVAALSLDEGARAMAAASGSAWSLDNGVLESVDPRDAAAIAAWRALGAKLDAGPVRAFSVYRGEAAPGPNDIVFSRALAKANVDRAEPSLDVRRASESGQGETWMLLASPCATLTESSKDAGLAALTIRALGRKTFDLDGVRIEPWVSSSGIGLLAHGPRRTANESSAAHAARLGNALGRAFAVSDITDEDAASARLELQSELDSETQLAWPVALEALAPNHPSFLDPRGTWQSITELSTRAVELERRALVRGPLRLAVLANGDPSQADAADREVERWLRPERGENVACPAITSIAVRPAEYEVESAVGASGSRALVAVPVPLLPGGGIPLEAEWTVPLLNRPNGWLDRSLRVPGLAVHAEAALLGGRDAAALTVEVVATGDKARDAASQVRAVLARLAEGAATEEDLTAAKAAYDDAQASRAVDPRERVVRLWLGRTNPASLPDLAALRRFHHEALAPEHHVVVLPRLRP